MIVDAHLDLSYNALRGREVLRPAREQAADDEGVPTVGVPDLVAGSVGLICATLFSAPSLDGKPGYRTPQEANDDTLAQLKWYRQHFQGNPFAPVTSREQLAATNEPLLRYIVLLEGADSIRNPEDVRTFFEVGVRVVGGIGDDEVRRRAELQPFQGIATVDLVGKGVAVQAGDGSAAFGVAENQRAVPRRGLLPGLRAPGFRFHPPIPP